MISFDLDRTLEAVIAQGRAELGDRGLRLVVDRDAGVWTALRGDEHRLRTCLQLLMGHAIAVSERGTITLTARGVHGAHADRQRVRFEVRDARPPAPVRFEDGADDERPEPAEGTDALSLWFGMTRLMTHELGMSSSSGRGNVCWFTVGFERSDMQTKTERRVLVVDDNLINQQVASHILKRMGCVVDVADNGQQAVDAVATHSYHLILMDCQMPIMDGYAATEEIRRREEGQRHTPIVALTAHAQDDNRRQCLDIGMDGFVTKPVNGKALEDVLKTWVE